MGFFGSPLVKLLKFRKAKRTLKPDGFTHPNKRKPISMPTGKNGSPPTQPLQEIWAMPSDACPLCPGIWGTNPPLWCPHKNLPKPEKLDDDTYKWATKYRDLGKANAEHTQRSK